MRKQTKLVAVLSAAALLAIGASMTSFAKGWTEENGEWVYLDSDDERVTQEWKKSGSNYYWLDEDGVMATDQIVEDDDDVYYVNEYGVRVKNQWISVENEDDVDVNGEEVDTLWYYFGDNGKAYKADDGDLKKKTVAYAGGNGVFFFDADGHMACGWIDHEDDRYYCGTENEGWAYTSWQYLEPDDDIASSDYDDMEWFCFKDSGKMRTGSYYYAKRYYTLDENGVCLDDWFTVTATSPTAASGADAYASESGSVGTGWVYTEDKDENDTYWYYLVTVREGSDVQRSIPFNSISGDKLYRAKTIKSKTYVFDETGAMIDGLLDIRKGTDDGVKHAQWINDEGETKYGLPEDTKGGAQSKRMAAGVYYFNEDGGSVNGQMVTGKTAVTDDSDTDYYYFDKSTGAALRRQVKDGVVYGDDGKRIQADDGNTNEIMSVDYPIAYSKSQVVAYTYVDEETGKNVDVMGIPAGQEFIVSSTGKLRTSGTVKVDGTKYKITTDKEKDMAYVPVIVDED